MEPKFKVGDKVKILPRIGSKNDYPACYIDEMLQYVGTIHIIEEIVCRDSNDNTFKYKCDGYNYILSDLKHIWTSPMLEKVSELKLIFTKESKKIKLNFN